MDQKITKDLQAWLDTPQQDRDITAGATLLLRLNRNRALFNTIIRKPEKFAAKLEYEIKKHLKIRQAGLMLADVARIEAEVMPQVQQTIAKAVISTDDEHPEAKVMKGKRADHDSLPQDIRDLWDKNIVHYERINQLFEDLKKMSHMQPCDRYEMVQCLASEDKAYRDNLAAYDAYQPSLQTSAEETAEETETTEDNSARAVANARKNISKNLSNLRAAKSAADKEKYRFKLKELAKVVTDAGEKLTDKMKQDFARLGVTID